MEALQLFSLPLLTIAVYVTALFAVSVAIKRNDIADIAWGPGIALAAWSGWYAAAAPREPAILLTLSLISIWALRLAWRIGRKNRNKPEDARYKRWRESWGSVFYLRSYLQVFLLQGFLMLLLASSAIALTSTTITNSSYMVLGTIVWIIGFFFEVVGDAQLDQFLHDNKNKGKLMRYGLWKYSRHPNYFGEITMWWGLALIALTSGAPLWLFISPITITLLILFVSGIPLLEEHFKEHPEWPEYKKRTSVLIPLPPKK